MHRFPQRVIVHQPDPAEPRALLCQVREGNLSHGERDEAVGEAGRAVEPHRPPGLERALELGRAAGLHPPHPRPAPRRGEPHDHARDQPAAAHRDHDRLDARELLGDLEAHGGLSRDDVGVIERRDDGQRFPQRDLLGLHAAILRGAAREHDFPAPLPHARNLHRRRGLGHHHHRPDPDVLSRVGHGLPVVAARVGDHPAPARGLGEFPDRVVGPADLERTGRLEALELQVRVQGLHVAQRSPDRHAAEARGRLAHALGRDHRYFFARGRPFGFAVLLAPPAGASFSSSPPSPPFSPTSSLTTRATPTTRSPGVRFMIFTPWVLRPEMRIPSTGTRIMMPFFVIIMSSSSGRTSFSATMSPVLSARLSVMMPRPPRCWTRYSSSSERLPIPISVTVRSVEARRTTTIPITSSFLSSSIPFTPVAVRPMARTSFSWNRMLMPCRVARTMSFEPSVTCTSISSSPFSMLIARMPAERGLSNSESAVFFTTPCLVAKNRNWSWENSRTGTSAATCSSGLIAMHPITGLPRAARAACGISCTFSQ